ncbi:MAG: ribose 5-phosphate isomerase B [Acidobacteria bacterium]|nr:MAG: ribose 5-phosphate isomerase B [Acidobacteriota bacterium]
MIVALGADHAGAELKDRLAELLRREGHELIDRGTDSSESVDYPDFAEAVAADVSAGRADRGLLVCGTGIGMAMAANKIRGVRAANVRSVEEAELSRQHNDANILCLGARFIDPQVAEDVLNAWLKTDFEGGRHVRRVEKIGKLEGPQQ